MSKKSLVILVTLISMLVMVGSVSAITWGEPDGDDHPQVVAILYLRPTGFFTCTGTLLSPTVVLTAGHCTEEGGQNNVATWVRNDPLIDVASEAVNYPTIFDWLADLWVFGAAVPHPQFDDYAELPDTYDIGVVLLEEAIDVPQYGEMPDLDYFDFLEKGRGSIKKRRAVVVGYGDQVAIPAFEQADFERYRGISAVIGVGKGANAGPQNFKFTNNPGKGSGSGGTCSGDSGAPAFWIDRDSGEETNTIMAINSYGITPLCNGNDYQFRTDTATALDFVNSCLQSPETCGAAMP